MFNLFKKKKIERPLEREPEPRYRKCFESIHEAAQYLGKDVEHNPVEMSSRTGTLLAVESNGICVVGDWTYRVRYWQCKPAKEAQ